MSQLGRNIRKHRERLGLNRSAFARKIGVSPTAVQNWEDQGVSPRPDIMMAICDLFDVDPVTLIDDGTDDGKPGERARDRSDPREALAELKRQMAELLGVPPGRVDIMVRY